MRARGGGGGRVSASGSGVILFPDCLESQTEVRTKAYFSHSISATLAAWGTLAASSSAPSFPIAFCANNSDRRDPLERSAPARYLAPRTWIWKARSKQQKNNRGEAGWHFLALWA